MESLAATLSTPSGGLTMPARPMLQRKGLAHQVGRHAVALGGGR
jgi:hypothetical protein